MSTNNISAPEEFIAHWQSNAKYIDMLAMMASLSKLFSDSNMPYLDYRLAENLFCKYFPAINDARACTAYDAHIDSLGIGIKTFTLKTNESSVEKIAEFNRLKPSLDALKGKALAIQLGIYRNDRMQVSNNAYGINQALYHIVGRDTNMLKIFNTPYDKVDIDSICDISDNERSIHFNDGHHEYSFNKSKSVLLKRFIVPTLRVERNVDILENPISLLERLLIPHSTVEAYQGMRAGYDYVILPLYSVRDNKVPEKSGLNQWNARGRKRDENEIYIPIPSDLNRKYPDFFPPRDTPFILHLPNGRNLSAKKCQEGGKALMSNPNSALGEWLLRTVMNIPVGQLVTMRDLEIFGFDSVAIYNLHKKEESTGLSIYSIQFVEYSEDYKSFIER